MLETLYFYVLRTIIEAPLKCFAVYYLHVRTHSGSWVRFSLFFCHFVILWGINARSACKKNCGIKRIYIPDLFGKCFAMKSQNKGVSLVSFPPSPLDHNFPVMGETKRTIVQRQRAYHAAGQCHQKGIFHNLDQICPLPHGRNASSRSAGRHR